MSLDSIVNIQITVRGRAPEQRDVGTPMLFGYHTAWLSDLVREYAEADDMLTDGFTADDFLYKAAQTVKAQDPSPQRFKIGRRVTPLTQVIELTPSNVTVGYEYRGTVGGKALSYVVEDGDDVADVVTGLVAAVNALDVGTTAAPVGGPATHLTCTADEPGTVIAFDLKSEAYLTIKDATVDTTTDNELPNVAAEDADWYGLAVCDSFSKATGLLVAAWTETQRKEAVIQSPDTEILDADEDEDLASALLDLSYARTGLIYHRAIGGSEWLAAGWLGNQLGYPAGSATPAFKEVTGVSTDKLTDGQFTAVLDKRASHYTRIAGLGTTYEGKTGSGEFLDTTRGVDALFFDMQDSLFGVFQGLPKVPYTDGGALALSTAVKGALGRSVDAGTLADDPAPVVTSPLVRNVTSANKINRRYPDMKFEATLQGAIHGLTLKGTIAV